MRRFVARVVLMLLLVACHVSLVARSAHADITTGLVAYWKLDDNTGTTANDSSGTGNNATLAASPGTPTWTSGRLGYALNFDGTDDYASEAAVDLSTTNVVTVSLWLYQSAWNDTDDLAVETTVNWNSYTTGLIVNPNGGSPCAGSFWIGVRGNVGYNIACYNRPGAGAWHHIVAVFDKSQTTNEVDLYIDGLLQTPTSRPPSYTSNNTNNFGNDPIYLMSRGGSSLFTAGKLDEVRIYTRALSAGDVTELFGKGPLAYWKFDENTGTTTTDSTGSGYTGTLATSPATPTWTTGRFGYALNYDGGDYATFSSVTKPADFSYSMWLYLNASQSSWATILEFGNDSPWFGIDGAGGKLQLYLNNPLGATVLSTGVWYHAVLTSAGGVSKIYLNGVQDGGNGTGNTATTVGFGLAHNNGDNYFNGRIDDLRIYNRALSVSEIRELYSGGALDLGTDF